MKRNAVQPDQVKNSRYENTKCIDVPVYQCYGSFSLPRHDVACIPWTHRNSKSWCHCPRTRSLPCRISFYLPFFRQIRKWATMKYTNICDKKTVSLKIFVLTIKMLGMTLDHQVALAFTASGRYVFYNRSTYFDGKCVPERSVVSFTSIHLLSLRRD